MRILFMTLALLAAFIMGGCASGANRLGGLESFMGAGFPEASMATVADHLAESLAEFYPPGHTSLYLKQTGHQGDTLGSVLESALRARGFTVTAEPTAKALTVAYVLDRLDSETWYTRLTVSSGLTLARTYRQVGQSLEPVATTKTERSANGHK